MKTTEIIDGKTVSIDWEIDYRDLIDEAGDGHVFMYMAYGVGDDGDKYVGCAVECDGEVEQIDDVEKSD